MGRMAGGRGWSQAEHNYAKNCYDTQSFCAPYFTFRFGSAFRLAFPGSPTSPSWMRPAPSLHACHLVVAGPDFLVAQVLAGNSALILRGLRFCSITWARDAGYGPTSLL